jgi:hypothetical protein
MESEIFPKEEFAAARLNAPVTFLLAANLTQGALSWVRHDPFEADELLTRDDPNEKAAIVGQRA